MSDSPLTSSPVEINVPRIAVEQFTLDNGLRVLLSQDATIPVVSVAVYYDVGSRDEPVGRTGFAHLFEHMMFQGSENVPKAGHFQFISNAGGTMNGTTSTERTNYYETLPASQLPLALWLESDRMRSLKITEENFNNQRDAVKEEKRLRYDNQPYINAFLRISELIFANPHNAHSTIGSMEDLDAATVEDCREFFRVYYAPNNAVLSIVGDFDRDVARKLVEEHFAAIDPQSAPPRVDVSEPDEVAQRADTYRDRFAPSPAFVLGWKAPARRDADAYALSLASDLLVGGESSRLYQKLVKDDESVLAVQGGYAERRGPSSFYIFALVKQDQDPEQIRATVLDEIRRLATEGPTPQEMEKLRNGLLNDSIRALQSTMYRAQRLAEYALYDGDPQLINTDLDAYLAVTAERIRDTVLRYLDTDNRVTLEIVPAAADAGEGVPSSLIEASRTDELTIDDAPTTDAVTADTDPATPPPLVPSVESVTDSEADEATPIR